MCVAMKLLAIYECLCDPTRLRILNLLGVGPLCVCHLHKVLGKSQVVVSQHLAYLRQRGMVGVKRHRNWMIYSLPPSPPAELETNLKCLQDCVQTEPVFGEDRQKLAEFMKEESCCLPEPIAAHYE